MRCTRSGACSAILVSCLLAALAVATLGCGQSRAPNRGQGAQPSPEAGDRIEAELRYVEGSWWRADLNHVVLPFAVILVRHERAADEPRLRIAAAPSTRSFEQAVQLARELAAKAKAAPDAFGELARKLSEDANTAPLGGAMGAQPVTYLPPNVVDALGHLQVGEVSEVVRTKPGLLVVKRLPPPKPQQVEGRTIVIRYATLDSDLVPVRPVVRTRAQARQLAEQVAAEARAAPARFVELAARHSDDWGGPEGGDYGRWSTRELTGDGLAVEVLRMLAPQQVSHVVDDPALGFRIFQRTSGTQRPFLAYSAFILSSQDVSTQFERTRQQARDAAAQLLAQLRSDPTQFDALRAEHCDYGLCNIAPSAYEQGRGAEAAIDARLPRVAVGEILDAPVESAHGVLIVRREDPAKHPAPVAPEPRFTLPSPDAKALLTAAPKEIAWYTEIYTRSAIEQFGLRDEDAEGFTAIMKDMSRALEAAAPHERQAIADAASREVEALLGVERAARLAAFNAQLMVAVQTHRPP